MARDSRKGQKGPGRTKSIPTVAQWEKAERAALARGYSSPSRGSTHHPITHTCTHPVCDCVHSPSSIQHLLFIRLWARSSDNTPLRYSASHAHTDKTTVTPSRPHSHTPLSLLPP